MAQPASTSHAPYPLRSLCLVGQVQLASYQTLQKAGGMRGRGAAGSVWLEGHLPTECPCFEHHYTFYMQGVFQPPSIPVQRGHLLEGGEGGVHLQSSSQGNHAVIANSILLQTETQHVPHDGMYGPAPLERRHRDTWVT